MEGTHQKQPGHLGVKDLETHSLETARQPHRPPGAHSPVWRQLPRLPRVEIILGEQEGFENEKGGFDALRFSPNRLPTCAFSWLSFK